MVFNSFEFALFFVAFFVLYWYGFNQNLRAQNLFILIGSYAVYAWWDWRFLSLLIGSSLVNFILGIYIGRSTSDRQRRLFLYLGLLQGLGGLLLFKYFNFFIASLVQASSFFNIALNIHSLNVILPLGISFYTFRTISYLLDVEKGKIIPERDWVVFFDYVAFFPSLVSGPIDRAKTLIPQLEKKRVFEYAKAVDGTRQILWGLFKKIVIADNCARFTDQIFGSYQSLPASSLLLGTFFFTIQLYADFSGYSDMAIGFARLLGFEITKNFDFPFFSQNIPEFWQKWHMSLTSWLTDYVFAPLNIAFRDLGNQGLILAILINFVAIGIWHGANWTFVLFGFLHGSYYIPLILRGTLNKRKKIAADKLLPSGRELLNISLTFILVMFTFIIFRVESISQALDFMQRLFSASIMSVPVVKNRLYVVITLFFIFALLLVEWMQRDKEHGLQIDAIDRPGVRLAIYQALLLSIVCFGPANSTQFIYFQF